MSVIEYTNVYKGEFRVKRTWIAVICAVVLAALLAAGAILMQNRHRPVMVCGDYALSNTEFGYYYWSEFFYFYEAYGEYLAETVDFSRPLSEQAYDADRSWEDYLLEEAMRTVRDTMAMVLQAEADGFTMPQDYESTYQQILVNFAAAAREGGYKTTEAYLKASYGKSATMESFEQYLRNAHLAAAYADRLLEACVPADEAARAYFQARQAEYLALYELDPEDESTWLELARQDLQNETYQNAFLTICSRYSFRVNEDAVKLTPPANLYQSEN